MSIKDIIANKGRDFVLIHLFGVVSGQIQVVLGCYGSFQSVLTCCSLFRFSKTAASQNVSTCKFTKKELHVPFYFKMRQVSLQSGVKK